MVFTTTLFRAKVVNSPGPDNKIHNFLNILNGSTLFETLNDIALNNFHNTILIKNKIGKCKYTQFCQYTIIYIPM